MVDWLQNDGRIAKKGVTVDSATEIKELLNDLRSSMTEVVEDISSYNARFDQIDTRLDDIYSRMQDTMSWLEKAISRLEKANSGIDYQLGEIRSRLDSVESLANDIGESVRSLEDANA